VLLWFGIPALTSRSPFVAGSNALGSGRRLRSDRVFGTVGRFRDLNPTVLELTALVAVAIAAVRRDRVALALAAGACAWVIVEIAFSLHGWPGLGRYMFEPAAVVIALAGAAVGWLLADPPPLSRLGAWAAWAGIGLAVVAVVALVPSAVSRARDEHRDIRSQRARTAEIGKLSTVVAGLGGPDRLRKCGEPLTRLEYQTVLAWTLHDNVASVGYKYGQAIARGTPVVLFTPLSRGGWRVQALHQRLAACRALPG
jgi:heme exporter protein D